MRRKIGQKNIWRNKGQVFPSLKRGTHRFNKGSKPQAMLKKQQHFLLDKRTETSTYMLVKLLKTNSKENTLLKNLKKKTYYIQRNSDESNRWLLVKKKKKSNNH